MRSGIIGIFKRKPGLAALATCALCALPVGAAQAQSITENLTGDLSGFTDVSGNTPSPLTAINGQFTVTFDPSAGSFGPTTAGLTVDSFSGATIDSPFMYAWNSSLDILSIGASVNTYDIFPGANDVVYQFNLSNLAAPRLSLCSEPGFQCDSANGNSTFYASGYTVASNTKDAWFATVANGVSVNGAPEIDAASAVSAMTLLLGSLAILRSRRRPTPGTVSA